jgi:Transposase DDE domain group 1
VFGRVEGRPVVAEFDGGVLTSDAGGLLLGAADRRLDLVRRLAGCFRDARDARFVEHSVATLVGQRVFGIALGYEDLNDHDELRHDPLLAVLAGKLEASRDDCAPVAGKSTLNRLELSRETATRRRKISHDPAAIEALLVDLFLDAHAKPPQQIVLDLDATDDPLHGDQEGRFFHGYYDCYGYLPLYVFCGRHLLAAKLRPSNIDGSAGANEEIARIVAQIRGRWPGMRILLRADSGFAREALMAWREQNRVDFVFGLARNARLVDEIDVELLQAEAEASSTGKPARRFKAFRYATLDSWSRRRRVIGKAEWTEGEANPGFIVTSLRKAETNGRFLDEQIYCARGDIENRIKECEARPVRRPNLDGHDARQPVQALVRLVRLCSPVRGQAHRPCAHAVRPGHLRNDPAQAPQARGPRPHQRAAHQIRPRLGLSLRRPMALGCSPTRLRRRRDADKSRQSPQGPPETRTPPTRSAQTAPRDALVLKTATAR